MFKLTVDGVVKRDSDNATVPADEQNLDYVAYLQWVAAGNTPPVIPPIPPSPIQLIRAIEAPNDDDRVKLFRQWTIASMFKEARALAILNPAIAAQPAAAVDAYVQSYLMAQGKGYAKLYLEEQAIIPIRELIP